MKSIGLLSTEFYKYKSYTDFLNSHFSSINPNFYVVTISSKISG